MGCIHADGGSPNRVCGACERAETSAKRTRLADAGRLRLTGLNTARETLARRRHWGGCGHSYVGVADFVCEECDGYARVQEEWLKLHEGAPREDRRGEDGWAKDSFEGDGMGDGITHGDYAGTHIPRRGLENAQDAAVAHGLAGRRKTDRNVEANAEMRDREGAEQRHQAVLAHIGARRGRPRVQVFEYDKGHRDVYVNGELFQSYAAHERLDVKRLLNAFGVACDFIQIDGD